MNKKTILGPLLVSLLGLSVACGESNDPDGTGGNGGSKNGEENDGSGGKSAQKPDVVDGIPSVTQVMIGGAEAQEGTLKGVSSDAVIVLTFSESMDPTSTQAAYSSTHEPIKPSNVSFSWNTARTELTITPHEKLTYKEVSDLSDPAEVYSFTLATTALSKDKVELSREVKHSFSPRRKSSQTLFPDLENTAYYAFLNYNKLDAPRDRNAAYEECHKGTHLGFSFPSDPEMKSQFSTPGRAHLKSREILRLGQ